MIEAHGPTKRYKGAAVVSGLSFTIRPGRVTGFLGPNGAGKSTTMRMILGLDHPSAGTVTVNGTPYAGYATPLARRPRWRRPCGRSTTPRTWCRLWLSTAACSASTRCASSLP
jgi:ABC-type Fe3+/spermidine/putrescine transport system ATPase subunit